MIKIHGKIYYVTLVIVLKMHFTSNYATGNSYSSYSNDIDNANYLYMSRDEILNREIPVYAFECAPCEFIIENHF